METKQTAVQLLQDKLLELKIEIDSKTHEEAFFLFEQAKQMEKEQIGRAYQEGLIDGMNHSPKEYCNETYGK
jgi:hypothetical protein